jgi:tetratricopeptide (TPR) repeat protein
VARDVRPFGARRRLIAVTATALLVVASPTSAQSSDAYDALVDEYAAGRAINAITALAAWPLSAAAGAAATRGRALSIGRQRAAIMLHTETAYAFLAAGRKPDAGTHFTAARRILSSARGSRLDERVQMFERRWYALVASMYSSLGFLQDADLTVRDGMGLYARDARLHVMRGAIREMDMILAGGRQFQMLKWFDSAAADYLRAIAFDDTLASAHLRLGSVRFLAHDERCGAEFEAALARASDAVDRYLARLFLGAFAESQHRPDDAREHYEAALEAGPAYQSAYVALSRLEESVGRSARAQELAQMYAALPTKLDDPWWNFHLGGFDQSSLDWLRREARTP